MNNWQLPLNLKLNNVKLHYYFFYIFYIIFHALSFKINYYTSLTTPISIFSLTAHLFWTHLCVHLTPLIFSAIYI